MSYWTLYGTVSNRSGTEAGYTAWKGEDGIYQLTHGNMPSSEAGYGELDTVIKLKGLDTRDFLPAIGNGFGTDDKAARVDGADFVLLNHGDIAPILRDARFLAESIQDNDIERWHLSRGGQFIRETGDGGGRFYVVPAGEAREMLEGWVCDEVMTRLDEAGAFGSQPAPKA